MLLPHPLVVNHTDFAWGRLGRPGAPTQQNHCGEPLEFERPYCYFVAWEVGQIPSPPIRPLIQAASNSGVVPVPLQFHPFDVLSTAPCYTLPREAHDDQQRYTGFCIPICTATRAPRRPGSFQ